VLLSLLLPTYVEGLIQHQSDRQIH